MANPSPTALRAGRSSIDRRRFLQRSLQGVTTAAAVSGPWFGAGRSAVADLQASSGSSETLAAQLYKSLTPKQKELVAFPFDHPLRRKLDANWHITKAVIQRDFDADQQALIRQIFLSLHSEQYAQQVLAQVEHDNHNAQGPSGFGSCSVALFGAPGSGKFEFVFTGRHVTRRCDGDSVDGAVFGGPIFYGHAAESFNEKPDHPGNIYWYQAKQANALFQALDGKQRKLALRDDPRGERQTKTVTLERTPAKMHGIPVAELSPDQRNLAHDTMMALLAPFREADVEECKKRIPAAGLEQIHFAFYKTKDIGNDGVWDIWQVQGPNMVWFFRGSPHVHTWVHIQDPVS